jgi:methanogenic corrinoid protein MtbC1
LGELTRSGQGISFVAKLPTERLRELAARLSRSTGEKVTKAAPADASSHSDPSVLLADCLAAVKSLEEVQLESVLRRAEIALGNQGMLQKVAGPLAQAIGRFWREGDLTAAHEHFCSAVLRTWLARTARSFVPTERNPVLVVTTPTGQLHELGALLVAALAANLGWSVMYLGPSLPAAEIAIAVREKHARAVALSLVYPEDDASLPGELARLREIVPTDVRIVVGGRAMPAYRDACDRIGARTADDLTQLGDILDEFRRAARANG